MAATAGRKTVASRAGACFRWPKRRRDPSTIIIASKGRASQYWRAIAQGMRPAETSRFGPDGAWWELQQDVDGYVVQNGGIAHPQETKVNPGRLLPILPARSPITKRGRRAG